MKTKLKLIKLSESHYIVVSDEEIKEGVKVVEKYADGTYKLTEATSMDITINKDLNHKFQFKITHSTQPLETVTALPDVGQGEVTEFGFNKIKHLTLSEAQEIEFGYSVEKLIRQYTGDEMDREDKKLYAILHSVIKQYKELVKDKLFTFEDMQNSLLELIKEVSCEDGSLVSKTPVEAYKWIEKHTKSLLPKTEWGVEFIDGKLTLKTQ